MIIEVLVGEIVKIADSLQQSCAYWNGGDKAGTFSGLMNVTGSGEYGSDPNRRGRNCKSLKRLIKNGSCGCSVRSPRMCARITIFAFVIALTRSGIGWETATALGFAVARCESLSTRADICRIDSFLISYSTKESALPKPYSGHGSLFRTIRQCGKTWEGGEDADTCPEWSGIYPTDQYLTSDAGSEEEEEDTPMLEASVDEISSGHAEEDIVPATPDKI